MRQIKVEPIDQDFMSFTETPTQMNLKLERNDSLFGEDQHSFFDVQDLNEQSVIIKREYQLETTCREILPNRTQMNLIEKGIQCPQCQKGLLKLININFDEKMLICVKKQQNQRRKRDKDAKKSNNQVIATVQKSQIDEKQELIRQKEKSFQNKHLLPSQHVSTTLSQQLQLRTTVNMTEIFSSTSCNDRLGSLQQVEISDYTKCGDILISAADSCTNKLIQDPLAQLDINSNRRGRDHSYRIKSSYQNVISHSDTYCPFLQMPKIQNVSKRKLDEKENEDCFFPLKFEEQFKQLNLDDFIINQSDNLDLKLSQLMKKIDNCKRNMPIKQDRLQTQTTLDINSLRDYEEDLFLQSEYEEQQLNYYSNKRSHTQMQQNLSFMEKLKYSPYLRKDRNKRFKSSEEIQSTRSGGQISSIL
ncbi:UNKNOWN [Stylonychia lemnae]|uniref:Uncharacterized protein n=1 Tax=Stylonychia lemnae TaxID=5949 RepID=A0A077ZUJ9_STYLE|nr:UNKNOWN [Stylonychia lemnae]|eukprot:CDW73234.1 UNKNOWN [Stylonychia lemnae]